MNVPRKRLLLIACLLVLAVAISASLLVLLVRHRTGGFGIDSPVPSGLGSDSLSLASQAGSQRVGSGTDAWKSPVKQRRLKVKEYTRPWAFSTGWLDPNTEARKKATLRSEFSMTIQILPLRHRGDREIARFQFVPVEKAPKYMVEQRCVLDVDTQTAQAVELHSPKTMPFEVSTFGAEKYLATTLNGFPVDWMIRKADLVAIPAGKTPTRQPRDERGEPLKTFKTLESTTVPSRVPGAAAKMQQAVRVEWTDQSVGEYRLVQVWVPGEPWWRSFHRYLAGYVDLEAFWEGEGQEKP